MFFVCSDDFLFWRQRVPVLMDVQLARAIERQHVSRRKLVYMLEKRFGGGSRQKSQIVIERLFINVWSDSRMLHYRLDLRREDEATLSEKVVKRLNTDAIAGSDEPC